MARTTLIVGPGLGAVCVRQLAAFVQRAHHAQRCAVGCCCQAPCVAVSQHPRFAPAGAPGLQLSHHAVRSYPSQFLQIYDDFETLALCMKPNEWCVLQIRGYPFQQLMNDGCCAVERKISSVESRLALFAEMSSFIMASAAVMTAMATLRPEPPSTAVSFLATADKRVAAICRFTAVGRLHVQQMIHQPCCKIARKSLNCIGVPKAVGCGCPHNLRQLACCSYADAGQHSDTDGGAVAERQALRCFTW